VGFEVGGGRLRANIRTLWRAEEGLDPRHGQPVGGSPQVFESDYNLNEGQDVSIQASMAIRRAVSGGVVRNTRWTMSGVSIRVKVRRRS